MDGTYAAAPRVTLRGAGCTSAVQPWNMTGASSPQAVGAAQLHSPSQDVRTGVPRGTAFTPVRAAHSASAASHGMRIGGSDQLTNRGAQALTPPSAGSTEADLASQGYSSPSTHPGVFRQTRQATPTAPLSFSPAPRSLATAVRAMTGSWAPPGQMTSAPGSEVGSSSVQRPILSNRSRPMNVMRHVSSPAGPASPESVCRSPGPTLRRPQASNVRERQPLLEAAEFAETNDGQRPALTSHNKAAEDVIPTTPNMAVSKVEAQEPKGPLRPHLYRNYPTKGLYA